MVAMFWYAHVRWSRRYRLGTVPATLLSLLLVFLVLVYVYPLRLLLGTFFAWITGGWLPMPLTDANGARPLAFMFTFYGLAFASMSACIGGLYVLAWRARARLGLDGEAAANAAGEVASHVYFVGVGLLSVLIAMVAATAALWLAFRTKSRAHRAGAALVMAGAVCSMHYTGMSAATVVCTSREPNPLLAQLLRPGDLPAAVLIVAVGIAFIIGLDLMMQRFTADRAHAAAAQR